MDQRHQKEEVAVTAANAVFQTLFEDGRSRISDWVFPKIEDLPEDRTRLFVVHGDSEDEKRHWQRYPVADNLCHVIVQGVGHKLSVLRKDGRLKWMVRSAVEADTERFLKVASKAGAVTRDRYNNSQEILS